MNNQDAILKEREQVNFRKLKCLEYIRELQKANKGIHRLNKKIFFMQHPHSREQDNTFWDEHINKRTSND